MKILVLIDALLKKKKKKVCLCPAQLELNCLNYVANTISYGVHKNRFQLLETLPLFQC